MLLGKNHTHALERFKKTKKLFVRKLPSTSMYALTMGLVKIVKRMVHHVSPSTSDGQKQNKAAQLCLTPTHLTVVSYPISMCSLVFAMRATESQGGPRKKEICPLRDSCLPVCLILLARV